MKVYVLLAVAGRVAPPVIDVFPTLEKLVDQLNRLGVYLDSKSLDEIEDGAWKEVTIDGLDRAWAMKKEYR